MDIGSDMAVSINWGSFYRSSRVPRTSRVKVFEFRDCFLFRYREAQSIETREGVVGRHK